VHAVISAEAGVRHEEIERPVEDSRAGAPEVVVRGHARDCPDTVSQKRSGGGFRFDQKDAEALPCVRSRQVCRVLGITHHDRLAS
jgi:hypothetical protein